MICPHCHSRVDDETDRCPICGMYILDSDFEDESRSEAPGIFSFASVLLGALSLAVWGAVYWGHAGGPIPIMLITPLIGYGLGQKGRKSDWVKTASLGLLLNIMAIVIVLFYIAYRIGNRESPLWLDF